MGKMNNMDRKNIIRNYTASHSCVLCGKREIDKGRIFHGRTVCSECLLFVATIPVEIAAARAASEAAYAV